MMPMRMGRLCTDAATICWRALAPDEVIIVGVGPGGEFGGFVM
eukprot:CAMPEP_0181230594 /NCGR_PEP_ID=MMETSP1096-20121128/34572_1 /TAXON_ID=156174 ORGANISM="Chrysochromulina ericina, Strain CCMP281" /NCGR_SAMPLE_ID=MMETSP1096 /ASSEMBLY_ACC=CAM_ASM_000453 /LENGTH=42 /DNA_ID= /DNA_START= /DNA_END= /DNA_ORIENTATION=